MTLLHWLLSTLRSFHNSFNLCFCFVSFTYPQKPFWFLFPGLWFTSGQKWILRQINSGLRSNLINLGKDVHFGNLLILVVKGSTVHNYLQHKRGLFHAPPTIKSDFLSLIDLALASPAKQDFPDQIATFIFLMPNFLTCLDFKLYLILTRKNAALWAAFFSSFGPT